MSRVSNAMLQRWLGCLLAVVLCACSSKSSEAASSAATSGDEVASAQPAVPTDPLAIVPGAASELAVLDLQALRASPHLAQARDMLSRAACIAANPAAGVLARTDRLVVARVTNAATGRAEVLAIGAGQYAPEDAQAVLAELAQAAGQAPGTVTTVPHERFQIVSDGQRSAAVLAPHMLVAADAAQLTSVLERIGGGGSDVRQGAIFAAVDAQSWIAAQHIAFLAAGSPERSEQLARQAPVGAAVRQAVAEGVLGVGVTLRAGAAVRLRWKLAQPEQAQQLVGEGRRLLWQLDLLLRLAGLPALGSRVQSEASGPLAEFALQVSDEELRGLAARLDAMLRARGSQCSAVAGPT
jgi:hypothetical protein